MNDHQFEFTHDWISGYFNQWNRLLPRKRLSVLEIGCFEGRATTWFLQREPGTTVTCIDTFEGGLDHRQLGVDFTDTQRRFEHNTQWWPESVRLHVGLSKNVLRELPQRAFDVVFVDGSHLAADVLTDITMSWPLLQSQGTLILDDYAWGTERPLHERPQPAIDAFLTCYHGQYELLERGYQVLVRKL